MTLAWLFERQLAIDVERANLLLAACGEVPWWIPGLWHLEVTNALLVAERRSVLRQTESDRFLAGLSGLPMLTDTDPTPERGTRVLALARDRGLSSYDAAYLELAQRLGARLASFNRLLNRAAAVIGVPLFAKSGCGCRHVRRRFRPGARPPRHPPGARSDRPHPAGAASDRCGCPGAGDRNPRSPARQLVSHQLPGARQHRSVLALRRHGRRRLRRCR